MITLLAYRPFIDSLEMAVHNLGEYWMLFLFPLVLAISIVYRGTKVAHLHDLPREAGKMFVQIIVVMLLAALAISAVYWGLMKWA
jgi:hypothetical protein